MEDYGERYLADERILNKEDGLEIQGEGREERGDKEDNNGFRKRRLKGRQNERREGGGRGKEKNERRRKVDNGRKYTEEKVDTAVDTGNIFAKKQTREKGSRKQDSEKKEMQEKKGE